MSTSRVMSRAQVGLAAPLVHVEVHLGAGLPTFAIVGLPAKAVTESKERVRAALANSGFELPAGRITVNLAPADLPKEGGRFDLPIALGILLASGQLRPAQPPNRTELYGELALSGELKPVSGLLLAALHAARAAHDLVVPAGNLEEAAIAAGQVQGAVHLNDVCAAMRGEASLAMPCGRVPRRHHPHPELDLSDVRGQWQAKRALEIAAAGGHSLLMIGPPGAGKSMLAQRLPTLLPPLSDEEALEVATLESIGGSGFDPANFGRRPFRAPHHTSSANAIVGGGPNVRPGAASLAHHGVLFLDELPEFDHRVIEALREPLESGTIAIARAAVQAEYPAQFQLVAAMNPCPCGYHGGDSGRCKCKDARILQYHGRISGPLLDRIDLRIEVPDVSERDLADPEHREASAEAAVRVAAARERQRARGGTLNARLAVSQLTGNCPMDREAERVLWSGRTRLGLSARGFHRALRVARTIADLAASDTIHAAHVAEALQLKRTLEEGSARSA